MSDLRRVRMSDVGECAAEFDGRTYFHSPDLEFGFELQLFAPFVFGLHEAGHEVVAVSRFPPVYFNFTRLLHPDRMDADAGGAHYQLHVDKPGRLQKPVDPAQRGSMPWRVWHPRDFDDAIAGRLEFWRPPPYKAIFRNPQFVFDKEILVIQNKYATEPWKHKSATGTPVERPYVFIPLDVLDRLFGTLKERYQIIYNRYTETIDASLVQDLGDFDLISEKYPDVLTIQDLARKHRLDHDETQLMVYANTDRFVGVQGGGGLLMHYFGGRAVIFHRLPAGIYDEIISGRVNFKGQMELQRGRNFYETLFPVLSGQIIEPCYDLHSFERCVLERF
jgi:hypothetical protein